MTALEKDLVDEIREALTNMGIVNWSGRIFMRAGSRRRFLPALGVGCPDILGVIAGRLFAIEAKRDAKSLERQSQTSWMMTARAHGVVCGTARSVDEALAIIAPLREVA